MKMNEKTEMQSIQEEHHFGPIEDLNEIAESVSDQVEHPDGSGENQNEDSLESESTDASEVSEDQGESRLIPVVFLSDWLARNETHLGSVQIFNVKIEGVNPGETIILSDLHPSGDYDVEGYPKRELFLFKNAHMMPVVDLPPESFAVFNSGLRIVYRYDDTRYLRCYGSKGALKVYFCLNVDDSLIPYGNFRVQRNGNGINIPPAPAAEILEKLDTDVNRETLQLLYKQAAQYGDTMITTRDAVTWLLNRQTSLTDIAHLIQIESVIEKLLA